MRYFRTIAAAVLSAAFLGLASDIQAQQVGLLPRVRYCFTNALTVHTNMTTNVTALAIPVQLYKDRGAMAGVSFTPWGDNASGYIVTYQASTNLASDTTQYWFDFTPTALTATFTNSSASTAVKQLVPLARTTLDNINLIRIKTIQANTVTNGASNFVAFISIYP